MEAVTISEPLPTCKNKIVLHLCRPGILLDIFGMSLGSCLFAHAGQLGADPQGGKFTTSRSSIPAAGYSRILPT